MMEKIKLESLLSTCYELEGLLMLAIKRDAETPEPVYESIEAKIHSLADNFASIQPITYQTDISADDAAEISRSVEYEEKSDAEIDKTKIPAIKQATASHTKFSINDRYQFIRELFNGNEAEFKDAVEALEEMETPEEMADYLYNDLCLNEQDKTVAHFISIMMASKNHE